MVVIVGWRIRGSNLGRGMGFFYFPKHPERLWSPHRLTPKKFEVLSKR
jgi:hypothetical protein